MRASLWSLALVALVGCQPGSPTDAPSSQGSNETVTEAGGDPGAFEVHEWGLVRIFADSTEIATSGHSAPPPPTYDDIPEPRKPVIYLHPLDGFDFSTEIQLGVGLTNGMLLEIWPTSDPTWRGEQHTFGPLTIEQSGCDASLAPTADSPFCAAHAPNVCETAELHAYLRPVDHCLQTPDGRAPILLYNGVFNGSITPVTVTHDRVAGTATVTNTSSYPVGPVWAVSLDGRIGPARYYHRIDALAPGEGVTLQSTVATFQETDHEALVADIRSALLEQGLTEDEAGDFIDAWRPDVLAPRTGIDPRGPWTAFGFFDTRFIAEQLPMTITPEPSALHRVIAFSLELTD